MLQSVEANDIHYLRHVTTLGERRPVVAHKAILSHNGIMLVNEGIAINRAMLDKLAYHHLLPPIDECLTVEGGVTAESLRQAAETLLAAPKFAPLLDAARKPKVLETFGAVPLSMPLAFKLTIAREERPDVFAHSLEVALLAIVLRLADQQVSETDLIEAAAAGLFHDIGLLHIDPQLLAQGVPLSPEGRHQLYGHPIIAHLILSAIPEWASHTADAVLQHHERLDGSGYPRGLTEPQISELGQILVVAELVAALLAREEKPTRRHLEIVLRMNAEQLPPRYAGYLLNLLNYLPAVSTQAHHERDSTVLPQLVKLAIAINYWRSIRSIPGDHLLTEFIDARIERLAHALADVGIDMAYWTTFDPSLDEDVTALDEIGAIAHEGNWQLDAITMEIRRKWERRLEDSTPLAVNIRNWLAFVAEPADTPSLV